jgi:hypothetical protein
MKNTLIENNKPIILVFLNDQIIAKCATQMLAEKAIAELPLDDQKSVRLAFGTKDGKEILTEDV